MKCIYNGYSSIGHLFDCNGNDNNLKGNRKALKGLLQSALFTFDDTVIDKEQFASFDAFFRNLPINIESSSQFLHCIMKQPKTDDVSYQLSIEKLVWNNIHSKNIKLAHLYVNYNTSQVQEEDSCFRLF